MSSKIPVPTYSSSRHPIETWQEWYRTNRHVIERQVVQQQHSHSRDYEIRLLAPYEYTDSLNQRQVWEPYLTGRERQEFDSQLRIFMRQNRSTMLRLRPSPLSPSLQSSSSRRQSTSGPSKHHRTGSHHRK